MSSMLSLDKDAFVRCHEAVHLVCSSAVCCIQDVIQTWHSQQQQKIGACTKPQQCPTTGKPKPPPRSCQACFGWGSALETVEYTDQTHAINSSIAWTNINATHIFNDPVEVAKAFGIKLPKGQKYPTTFDEFDTASLFLMMMKFEEFHRRDHSSYLIIKKASAIRNSLSHLKLADKLHISNQTLQSNFQDINDLINCLQRLHPNHFTATLVSDIRSQLHDVLNAPITAKMRDEALKPFTDAMNVVVCQTMEEQLKQFTPNISLSVVSSISIVNRDLKQEILHEVKHEVQKEFKYQAQTISTGFQQIADAYNVQQQGQAEATGGLHTMMETLHQTSTDQGHQNVQQIQNLGQQVRLDVQQVCATHEAQASAIVAELHSKMDTMQRSSEQGHQQVKQDIVGLKQELQQNSGDQSSYLQAQTSAIESLHSKMDRNQQQTICDVGVRVQEDVQLGRFDVRRCREELKAEYRQVRGKVPLLPGMPEEFGNMDDLYVDLELVEDLNKHLPQSQSTQLSQSDLLNLKDRHVKPLNRILVRGGPGCGKTMLVSKLAYDWATGSVTHPCARKQRELVFALDLREIRDKMDIIDIIQDQLLPKVDREGLMAYITSHPESVSFLLDGYDEAFKTVKTGDINHLLSNKWLQESLVIITTRAHKFTDFVKSFGTCTVVDVMKWSFQRISEFVVKYFDVMLFLGCIGNKVGEICEGPPPMNLHSYHPNFVANETIRNLQKELATIVRNLSDCVCGASESHREKAEEMLLIYRIACKKSNSDIHQEGLKELESFLKLFWSTYGPPGEIYTLLIEIRDFLKSLVSYEPEDSCEETILSGNYIGTWKQLLAVVELVRKKIHISNDIINTAEKIQCNLTLLKHSDMYTPNPTMTKALEEISHFVDKLCDFRTHWSRLQLKLNNITSLLEIHKCWKHFDNTLFNEIHLAEMGYLFHKSFGQPDLLTKVASRLQIFLKESLNVFGNWTEICGTFFILGLVRDFQSNLRTCFQGVALLFSTPFLAEHGLFGINKFDLANSADVEEVWTKCYREAELLREFKTFNFLMLTKSLQSKLIKLKPHLKLLSIVVAEREHEFQHLLINAEHFVEIFNLPRCSIPENVSEQVKKLDSFLRPFASDVSREDITSKVNNIVHLLEQIWSSQHVRKLTEIPCLLTMICMLWAYEEEMKLPATTTELYEQSVLFLAKHAEAKLVEAGDIDEDVVKQKLDAVMLDVGKLGLQGLIENKLVFSNNELENTILEESCRLGLVTKERRRSKLQSKTFVSFAHKTFQEYCAACYLTYLASGDRDVFEANIKQILPDGATSDDDNFLLLQFLCGLSSEAADHILPKFVQMSVSKLAITHITREITKTLILFKESRTPNTIKYLEPLLNKQLAMFVLEYNMVYIDVLRHLLDCQLQSDENNFMLNTYVAFISIQGQYSASHSELLAKLLQSLRNFKSLNVNLTTKMYTREIDIHDAITQSFDKLTKLDELKLSGPGCMYNLMTCLSQSKRVTMLKSLHIANTEVDTKSFAKVVSRQMKLEELSIIAFFDHSGGILETRPKVETKSRDRSTGGKEIGVDNFYHPLRLLFSRECEQLAQVFSETDTRTMLKSINIAFFKRLTLIGCEVPVKALCRLLPCLQLLNLHCLESDDLETVKPFDAKAFFSEIVAVGHVYCEHVERKTKVALPLATLELDNGAISVSAVKQFQQACTYLQNLQVLSLGWKSLEKETVPLFANGMGQLPHLSTLNLSGNHIGKSVEILCQKLADKPLTHLRLMQVSLTEEDADIFGQYLHYWPELITLDLSQNQIGSGMRSINYGLRNLKKLEYLALTDSGLDDNGIVGIPVFDLNQLQELHVAGIQKYGPHGIEQLFGNLRGTNLIPLVFYNDRK